MKKLMIIIGLLAFSCSDAEVPKKSTSDSTAKQAKEKSNVNAEQRNTENSKTKSQFTYKVIGTIGYYGYQIFNASGKMMINQPTIPAIQGNKGFQTENDAQIAAEYVIQKMDKGIFPPTFSLAELDSLGLKH